MNAGDKAAKTCSSAVYTLSGQKVANNLDEARSAGLPTGVYIVSDKKVVIM